MFLMFCSSIGAGQLGKVMKKKVFQKSAAAEMYSVAPNNSCQSGDKKAAKNIRRKNELISSMKLRTFQMQVKLKVLQKQIQQIK